LPQAVALTGSIVAGLLLLAPLMLLTSRTTPAVFTSPSIVFSVSYIAVFASVAAFLLWSYGISALGPTRSGQFILLMPVFGVVLAAVTLGETPTPAEACGGALVLAGIIAVERRT
jgi:drug/metabolite transporter (DMT)-like permease